MDVYKVVILDSALPGLDNILNYLVNTFSVDITRKYRGRILSAIQSLRTFPDIHPLYTRYKSSKKLRLLVVHEYTLVLYEVDYRRRMVYVRYIFDGRSSRASDNYRKK